MHINDIKPKLKYHSALMTLGKMNREEICNLLSDLMNLGVYEDEFFDIEDAKTALDFTSSAEKLFKKMGFLFQDKDEAIWVILAYHIKKMTNEKSDVFTELQKLIDDVYWNYDFYSKTKKFLGDSHDIQHLIGGYWEYDDIKERFGETICRKEDNIEEINNLKQETLKTAKQWLIKHPSI